MHNKQREKNSNSMGVNPFMRFLCFEKFTRSEAMLVAILSPWVIGSTFCKISQYMSVNGGDVKSIIYMEG